MDVIGIAPNCAKKMDIIDHFNVPGDAGGEALTNDTGYFTFRNVMFLSSPNYDENFQTITFLVDLGGFSFEYIEKAVYILPCPPGYLYFVIEGFFNSFFVFTLHRYFRPDVNFQSCIKCDDLQYLMYGTQ